MQVNKKNTFMLAKKHRVTCCLAAKHPKHNKLRVTEIREPVNFFNFDFCFRNSFANLASFATVSITVQSIISYLPSLC